MRRLLIALAALSLLSACPHKDIQDAAGGRTAAKPQDAQTSNTNESSAPSSPEEPSAEDAAANVPMAKFNIGGVYFGMTPQQFAGLFPSGGLLKTRITERKSFGVHEITVNPADGSKDRDMYAAFVDSALVHFTRRDPLDDKLYKELTGDLIAKYGQPSAVPPDCCAGNPYFKNFGEQSKQFAKVMFWSDPDTLCVLSAMTWPEKQEMHFLLFNPRLFELLGNRMNQAREQPRN